MARRALALAAAFAAAALLSRAPPVLGGGEAPNDYPHFEDEGMSEALFKPVYSAEDPSMHERGSGGRDVGSASDGRGGGAGAGAGASARSGTSHRERSLSMNDLTLDMPEEGRHGASEEGMWGDADAALLAAADTNLYEGEVVLLEPMQPQQQLGYQTGDDVANWTEDEARGWSDAGGNDDGDGSGSEGGGGAAGGDGGGALERGARAGHDADDSSNGGGSGGGGGSWGAVAERAGLVDGTHADQVAAATNSYEGDLVVEAEQLAEWQRAAEVTHERGGHGPQQQTQQQTTRTQLPQRLQQAAREPQQGEAASLGSATSRQQRGVQDQTAAAHVSRTEAGGRVLLTGATRGGEADEGAYDAEAARTQPADKAAAAALQGATPSGLAGNAAAPEAPEQARSGDEAAGWAARGGAWAATASGTSVGDAMRQPRLLGEEAGKDGRPLWGVTYSWRRAEACDGGRQVCRCPDPDQLLTDLELLQGFAPRVRTFSVECPQLMQQLLRASYASAHAPWLLLGVWVGRDAAANEAQLQLLSSLLREHPGARLAGIAVGSEAVSRGDVSASGLASLLSATREALAAAALAAGTEELGAVPVLTVEQPEAFTPELLAVVDVAGAVVQPFFGAALDTSRDGWARRAVQDALERVTTLRARAGGKQVVVAELGWPSRSGELDASRTSPQRAAEFAHEWAEAADAEGLSYYYHELADAAWKGTLRRGAAAAVRAARRAALPRAAGPPGVLEAGVMGDEHFGLVSADRSSDKGLVVASPRRSGAAAPAARQGTPRMTTQ